MRTIFNDLKRALGSPGFWLGVVILVAAGLLDRGQALDYIRHSEGLLQSPQGLTQALQAILHSTFQSDLYLLAIPLVAALPFGAAFAEEFKSRFVLASLPRTGFKRYIAAKVIISIVAGALCVLAAVILLVPLTLLTVFGRDPQLGALLRQLPANAAVFLPWAGMGILSGGFWGLVGAFCAGLMKNKYMAYITPFILYYVLSEFQTRYYSKLFLLSPKEWLLVGDLPAGSGVGILLGLTVLLGLGYAIFMKGRLKDV